MKTSRWSGGSLIDFSLMSVRATATAVAPACASLAFSVLAVILRGRIDEARWALFASAELVGPTPLLEVERAVNAFLPWCDVCVVAALLLGMVSALNRPRWLGVVAVLVSVMAGVFAGVLTPRLT